MRQSRRGAVLIAALMLSVVLLLMGMGFLEQRRGQYQAAREYVDRSQASALADAGLQDALGKLAKDIGFPPLRADDQNYFAYCEEFFDVSGASLGFFRVTVDMRYRLHPYRIIRVTSRGLLGSLETPRATVSRAMEIDMAGDRNLFRVLYVTTNEE